MPSSEAVRQVQPAYSGAIRVMPNGFVFPPGAIAPAPAPASLTPEQMEEARRNSLRMALVYERSAGTRSLILWGIVLAVSSILWLLHWRILRQERAAASELQDGMARER